VGSVERIATIACAIALMNTIETMHKGYAREVGEWLNRLAGNFVDSNTSRAALFRPAPLGTASPPPQGRRTR
jgi:hypothetical protein